MAYHFQYNFSKCFSFINLHMYISARQVSTKKAQFLIYYNNNELQARIDLLTDRMLFSEGINFSTFTS
jgi:hypothetical protein